MERLPLNKWVYLVFLEPILRILCFVLGITLPINTYILLAFMLCFVVGLRSGMAFCFFCYVLFEILFYPGDGIRQYMISYGVTILGAFFFLKSLRTSSASVDWKSVDKAMLVSFCVICFGQMVSIVFKGFDMSMTFSKSNVYGALIPHEFAYYNLIFSLYFILRKKLFFGLLALFLCALLGRRTSLLLAMLNLVVLFNTFFHWKKVRIVFSVLLFAVLCFGVREYIAEAVFYGLDVKELSSVSFFEENPLMNRWTRGRNLVWSSGIDAILERPISSTGFWFGNGPRSSVAYNEQVSGVAIWMHNDFVDVLLCLGVVGLFMYCFSLLMFSFKCGGLLFFLYWLIMAFFNGFMFYNSVAILFVFFLVSLYKRYMILFDKGWVRSG